MSERLRIDPASGHALQPIISYRGCRAQAFFDVAALKNLALVG